jgi:hypothetical protein
MAWSVPNAGVESGYYPWGSMKPVFFISLPFETEEYPISATAILIYA